MSDLVVPSLYEADVAHARSAPVTHRFTYRATYWLVDFDRVEESGRFLRWCTRIRREDHVDIRGFLAEQGRSASRILLLAGARSFGYAFDPISVFWCYGETDEDCTVVAEVHNTYGDRHAYLLEPDAGGTAEVDKAMYVSPFNGMGGKYRIRVSAPASSVSVGVSLEGSGGTPFAASLRGVRRPFTPWSVLRAAVVHSGARTRLLIQWEALRLLGRGLKVQPR